MSEFTDHLSRKWGELGPVIKGPSLTPAHDALRDKVPAQMFEVWQEFGFSGFDNGRFWLCDPLEWQDAADAWLETLDLEMDDDYWVPLVRGALGDLELWGPRTGMSVSIVPVRGEVYPNDMGDLISDAEDQAMSIRSALRTYDEDSFVVYDDVTEEPLFEECLAKLGPLTADDMYTFVPVPALGGQAIVETAVIEQAVPHMLLLASMQHKDVQGDISATQHQREQGMDEWIGGEG
ncbi:GAD-like domain-containing protein [Propionibacteriaceae bacterium G57]|uniref:GAD-like domain-containing protein n=1 Tax=Aestuariimicrobium sp. G57 TaxID=3418485 RepID=UPI003DA73C76